MNFTQNTNVIQKNVVNIVGFVYVPPALCLLPACGEPIGVAATNKLDGVESMANGLILFLELAP